MYFSHESFPKIKNGLGIEEPRKYQLSGDMIIPLLNHKKKSGIVQPYYIQAAYDYKKRKISFNGTKHHRFDTPLFQSLNITFKTRENDGNMNKSSSLTDVQAVYDGIRDYLNLDDTVPMQITYAKDGSHFYYQGGKLNNENLDEEHFSNGTFQILSITFPEIYDTITKEFMEKILQNKNNNKKITSKDLEKIYQNLNCIEYREKDLASEKGIVLRNVSLPFKNDKTTIGDIKAAIKKVLRLVDDVSVGLIHAGVEKKIDSEEVSDKYNNGNGLFECACVIRLGGLYISNDFGQYIQQYIREDPKRKITPQILKNFQNVVNPNFKPNPIAPTMDVFENIQQIAGTIYIHGTPLNIQSVDQFKDIILHQYPYLLPTIINQINDKQGFVNWFINNYYRFLPTLIYQYPGILAPLYKSIFPYKIEQVLQNITTEFPSFLTGKNAIAEILNNYEHWTNVLQTDKYRELNEYLYQNFGLYINFRYYQLYIQQTGFQVLYYNCNYQQLLFQLYQMPQPTAPLLTSSLIKINNQSNIKSSNITIENKTTYNASKGYTVKLKNPQGKLKLLQIQLSVDEDGYTIKKNLQRAILENCIFDGSANNKNIALTIKNLSDQEITSDLFQMSEDFVFDMTIDGQNLVDIIENNEKNKDEDDTKLNTSNLTPKTVIQYGVFTITISSLFYFLLYKLGIAPHVKNFAWVQKLSAWR